MDYEEKQKEGMEKAAIAHDAKKRETCRAFLKKGQCRFGDKCRYSHHEDPPMLIQDARITT